MNKTIQIARDFAIKKHGNKLYGVHSYVYHLDMVYEEAKILNLDNDYLVSSYLHDLLEDTNTTKKEIELLFNKRVSDMVDSVSGGGLNRKEKKISMINKLMDFKDGINLKMIDRFVNMRESKLNNEKLFNMYVKELDDYNQLFKMGDLRILDKINKLLIPTQKLKY
ncbi:hypothetical protein GW796_07955 [archaeon]|nr:hypothetical protein [archaeon]